MEQGYRLLVDLNSAGGGVWPLLIGNLADCATIPQSNLNVKDYIAPPSECHCKYCTSSVQTALADSSAQDWPLNTKQVISSEVSVFR